MWALRNNWDGAFFLGSAWGDIARAMIEHSRQQLEDRWLLKATQTPTADGLLVGHENIQPVEIERCDCDHWEEVREIVWRESARQTHLSPAERVSSCRACATAREQAKEAAEDARVDRDIDERRERRRA